MKVVELSRLFESVLEEIFIVVLPNFPAEKAVPSKSAYSPISMCLHKRLIPTCLVCRRAV